MKRENLFKFINQISEDIIDLEKFANGINEYGSIFKDSKN
jgi:hypothetical protein